MTIKKSNRREFSKALATVAVVGGVWHKPIVRSVVLPAHAVTSADEFISASSLDSENMFARYILIVDSNNNVLANCGASGGTVRVDSPPDGTYRIFADSDGAQNQRITVSTVAGSESIVAPTDSGACDFLVAQIEIPGGAITPSFGRQTATWDCSTNPTTTCG
ncbi:MAG: hypothetical protein KTR18_10205 [Acidiferrobacterales bacterium]|nr:hypothetical protein [Acidiferrobacterales bacterium]